MECGKCSIPSVKDGRIFACGASHHFDGKILAREEDAPMAQLTFEGFVEHGQIRLKDEVHLPEKTKVYAVVPESGNSPAHFPSPRLVHPEQASHFDLEIVEDDPHAGL